jgi:DNA-directed RNA polymerase specialized sigma24 family protein
MTKPLSLSDRQLRLVQQTIKNVPPRQREEFMAKLGAMLAPEPSDAAVLAGAGGGAVHKHHKSGSSEQREQSDRLTAGKRDEYGCIIGQRCPLLVAPSRCRSVLAR